MFEFTSRAESETWTFFPPRSARQRREVGIRNTYLNNTIYAICEQFMKLVTSYSIYGVQLIKLSSDKIVLNFSATFIIIFDSIMR